MSFIQYLKTVASNIRKLRQDCGLVQKEMYKFGYSMRHYQAIESGNSNLTLKTLWNLSKAFKVSISDLTHIKGKVNDNIEKSIYYKAFIESRTGIIFWELQDIRDPCSFVLVDFNKTAKKIILQNPDTRRGANMIELFPGVFEAGLHKDHWNVVKTGRAKILPDLIYKDAAIPLSIFSVISIKCALRTVAIMFDDVTEIRLAEERIARQKNLYSLE